jgi:hypothetical protein
VTAAWQPRHYSKGVKVSDAEIAQLHILKHDTCPQWNYTIELSYLLHAALIVSGARCFAEASAVAVASAKRR